MADGSGRSSTVSAVGLTYDENVTTITSVAKDHSRRNNIEVKVEDNIEVKDTVIDKDEDEDEDIPRRPWYDVVEAAAAQTWAVVYQCALFPFLNGAFFGALAYAKRIVTFRFYLFPRR